MNSEIEKCILVGVAMKSDPVTHLKEHLSELADLAFTAGAEVVGMVSQILVKMNSSTLIGSGKLNEVKTMVEEQNASLVIVDHPLSGSQTRNLEAQLEVRVLDRSQIILDIFAQRARTYEGKLQVELAQLMDQLPRMVGGWLGSLSRQAGGIGTRGPGESALELDRRRVSEKIKIIRKKLAKVHQNRTEHRKKRQRTSIPSFALVGYTNSGKSTLLNQLARMDTLTQDQVFATLDPLTKKIYLPNRQSALVTDTVGFIRKLPHQLIEAFKSTFEESAQADILIHVIDGASPQAGAQYEVVQELINEFNWDSKPIIHVLNKSDLIDNQKTLFFNSIPLPRVNISALKGDGLLQLKNIMLRSIAPQEQEVELYFPKEEELKIFELSMLAKIVKKEASPNGTIVVAQLTPRLARQWKNYFA